MELDVKHKTVGMQIHLYLLINTSDYNPGKTLVL